jgi:predicted glutamine amidotransferase
MCVIVLKVKGADFPSKSVISACMKANPDGYAAAWNENGVLKTFRTMDDKEMLAKYDEIQKLDPKETALLFHARIATHGSKTLANCHCWTNEAGTLAFAHNGILKDIGNRGDMTDSETFFRDYFLPLYEKADCRSAAKIASLVAKTENSRLAFINREGTIVPFGDFAKDTEQGHKGTIYFSNMNWTRSRMSLFPFDKSSPKKTTKPSGVSRGFHSGPLIIEKDDNGKVVNSYIGSPAAKAAGGSHPRYIPGL